MNIYSIFDSKFLSHLCGGEPPLGGQLARPSFLSHLCGGEQ